MRITKQIQTIAVLSAGALVGFLAASSEPGNAVRADVAQPLSVGTKAVSLHVTKATCCDAKLDRTLAFADAVAEVNAVALAQAEKAAKAGKKPNIVIIWGDDVPPHPEDLQSLT